MNVYFWGIGKGCEKALHNIKCRDIDILGFIDNNPANQGKEYQGKSVIAFQGIVSDYDYIIITVIKYEAIIYQLEKMNVSLEKIICYYSLEHCAENKGRVFDGNAWKIDLLEQRIIELEKKLNIRMANAGYEIADKIDKGKYEIPIVHDGKDAIYQIVNEHKSLIRFGDGEFEIMAGKERAVFQTYQKELANRLLEVIQARDERILLSIANNYGDLDKFTDEVADAIREYMTESVRNFHNSVLQKDRVYYDAYMFKSYFPYRDKSGTADRVALIKSIWNQRQVVIVEGDKTRTGYGNDLLDNVMSLQRIICPTQEAFNYYDKIFAEVKKVEKNKLILLVLGPTAKVLAYDLVKEGYQVVDIGQIDMDYEWYMAGKGIRVPIQNKYVSQLPPTEIKEIEDLTYQKQVIARIGV